METLQYTHCNCKEMSIAMVLLELNTKKSISELAMSANQQTRSLNMQIDSKNSICEDFMPLPNNNVTAK